VFVFNCKGLYSVQPIHDWCSIQYRAHKTLSVEYVYNVIFGIKHIFTISHIHKFGIK